MMILGKVVLSYPYISYNINVNHFTYRKPTTMEWLVLAILKQAELHPEYRSMNIDQILKVLFAITDADSLVKPVLMDLAEIGAITIEAVSDSTKLSNVTVNQLHFTDNGRTMQMKGLLPGKEQDDRFDGMYDIVNGLFDIKDRGAGDSEVKGVKVRDVESTGIAFPRPLIISFLEEKKKVPQKGRFGWIQGGSTFGDVTPVGQRVFWRNIARNMQCDEFGNFSVADNKDVLVADAVLSDDNQFENVEWANEIPLLDIANEKIENVFSVESINEKIIEYARTDVSCVISAHYTDVWDTVKHNLTKNKMVILCGQDSFQLEFVQGNIIVHLEQGVLKNDTVYANNKNRIAVGRIALKAVKCQREAAYGYTSKDKITPINNLIRKVVEDNYEKNIQVLLLLFHIGANDEATINLRKIIDTVEEIADKWKIVDEINTLSKEHYKKAMMGYAQYVEIFVDEVLENNQIESIADAEAILDHLTDISLYQKHEDVYENLIGKLLSHISNTGNIDDVWRLWNRLETNQQLWQHLKKQRWYEIFYNDGIMRELIGRYSDESAGIPSAYTPIEECMGKLFSIESKLHSLLPELLWGEEHSLEFMRKMVLNHNKEKINNLYETVCQWREKVTDLNRFIDGDVTSIGIAGSYFSHCLKVVDSIMETMTIFFDDASLKYIDVYIADTSALMRKPEMVDMFKKNRAMLIVPIVVMEELDKHKGGNDSEKSFAARKAIRQIDKYRSEKWLNIHENSNSDLLSKDLDPDVNDNKILSVALKFLVKSPKLITWDRNFRNIAESQYVESINVDDFCSKHEVENDNKSAVVSGQRKSKMVNNKQNKAKKTLMTLVNKQITTPLFKVVSVYSNFVDDEKIMEIASKHLGHPVKNKSEVISRDICKKVIQDLNRIE